ncbi:MULTISPECIES: hypothetical protein [unclassified Phenylobacterium]|uniref:hypothetical protein n=1 Tax=unclassified Phenylobacterium TaxID=2640670 RepID=UPI00083A2FDE|nr:MULTISPECIES: hypothetical protein [unclassified Phenylobacterium]
MGWERVTAMLVEVARGRGGYGALRSWFGQMPFASDGGEGAAIARMAGYAVDPSAAAFVELSAAEACDALAFFAVDSMVMPRGRAVSPSVADTFAKGVERLGPQARFFSNGRWHDYAKVSSFGWHGISDATFDGGVIGLNGEVAFIVWVEEED